MARLLTQFHIGYEKSYDSDKYHGKHAYSVMSRPKQIQVEIMKNGPVEAAFTVYADFPSYKSGRFTLKTMI